MKNFLQLISLILFLFLSGCAPVEEGVYFEVNCKGYKTNDKLEYGYTTDNIQLGVGNWPMQFYVSYQCPDFNFCIYTFNFHQGRIYFNEFFMGGCATTIGLQFSVKNDKLGALDIYYPDFSVGGEGNCMDIIKFNEKEVEFRFNARMKGGQGEILELKNGYLKVLL